jgi:hypothetical protein
MAREFEILYDFYNIEVSFIMNQQVENLNLFNIIETYLKKPTDQVKISVYCKSSVYLEEIIAYRSYGKLDWNTVEFID